MNRLHLLSLILVVALGSQAVANEVEVGVGTLNLRSTPNGRKLRNLTKGQKLEVVGSARNGSWLKVRVGNTTGYVFKRYTRPAPAAAPTTPATPAAGEVHTVDTPQGLNIRSSDSGRARKLGALEPGTEVEVIETKGNWRKVRAKVGGKTVTGWVYGRYLKKKPGKRDGMTDVLSGALSGREAAEGETPAGETPAGETPAGETPAGETPAGETPAGETPAGETPATPGTGAPAADTPGLTPATGTPAAGDGSLDAAEHSHDHGADDATSTGSGAVETSPRPTAREDVATSDASSMSLSKKQVTASSLNVRAEPSTTAEKIGALRRGEEVDVLELQGDWSRIRKGSLTGWVASRYLGEPGSTPPAGSGRVNYGRYRVSDPLVRQVLERIAAQTGRTVILTSGDRNYVPRGGSRTSLHLLRRAADFKVQGMSLSSVFSVIRNNRSTILAGAGFEVIYHQPGTNTGGPHLHVGRRGSSADAIKTERGGRYRYVN